MTKKLFSFFLFSFENKQVIVAITLLFPSKEEERKLNKLSSTGQTLQKIVHRT